MENWESLNNDSDSQTSIEELGESFVNGNISWVRDQIKRPEVSGRLVSYVLLWLQEYAPASVDSYIKNIIN